MAIDEHILDKLTIDTVGSLIVVTDDQGRIVRFNPAATKVTGYSFEDVYGRPIWDALPPPELRERTKARFSKLMAGETLPVQVEWICRNGERRQLSFTCYAMGGKGGSFEYTIGTGIDITELVVAQKRLSESTRLFQTAFEKSAIAIAIVDGQGRYVQVNPAFCKLMEYEVHELLERDLNHITHPDDRYANFELIHKLMAGAIDHYVFEKRHITKSGQIVWVQVSAALAGAESGHPATVIGMYENTTERRRRQESILQALNDSKGLNDALGHRVRDRTVELESRTSDLARSEAALRSANAQLEQANASLRQSERHFKELAEYNQHLAREVSHRVRNNLAGLLSLISLMRSRSPDVKSFADAMETRIAAMRHVHTLLAESQASAISLRSLLDGALPTLQPTAPYAAAIDLQGDDCFIPPRRVMPLVLVLVELFNNSCKYGPHSVPGGRIIIQWQLLLDNPPRLRLTWTEIGGPLIRHVGPPSLGAELIQGFVHRELSGVCELRYPRAGADHMIEFPLTDPPPPAPLPIDSADWDLPVEPGAGEIDAPGANI